MLIFVVGFLILTSSLEAFYDYEFESGREK
jgi:hypothetical protein